MPTHKNKLRELNDRANRLREEAGALPEEVSQHLNRLDRSHLQLVTDDEKQSA